MSWTDSAHTRYRVNLYMYYRYEDESAYPQCKHCVERSHGGAVILNRIYADCVKGHRGGCELSEQFRIAVHNFYELIVVFIV